MNATDSSVENFRASSSASSITTGAGVPSVRHLIHGQAQDVTVDGGHAIQAPVIGFRGDALIDRGGLFGGAANQRFHEFVRLDGIGIFIFRIQRS